MRLTRAAQRAQHVDEPTDATDFKDRAPLNEISPNASPELGQREEEQSKKASAKKARGKGGAKKKAKGKKGKAAEEEEQIQVVLGDECDAAGSPASDGAVEDLAKGPSDDAVQTPMNDEQTASPPSKSVRLTRRQLAMQEEVFRETQHSRSRSPHQDPEAATEDVAEAVDTVAQTNGNTLNPKEDSFSELQQEEFVKSQENPILELGETQQAEPVETHAPATSTVETEQVATTETESTVTEVVAPSVEITSEPEPKTLYTEKPVEDAMTPIASRTPSRRTSRSPSKSPMRIEESIEAIDALEEALENVEAVTSFSHSSDEKSPRKKTFPRTAGTPNTRGKTPKRIPPSTTRISRTPSAAPKSIKPMNTSLARASSVRVAPSKDIRKGSTETVDYLATKRRPISLSFPTPPPPPKGRAPTRPTFQLSSTAVTEKLKQDKEERLKRQAEGVVPKQRPISMPPPPRSSKPPTKPHFQLPGEKIAAELKAKKEERLKREAEGLQQSIARPVSGAAPPPKSSKPPTKPNFELPGAAVAERLKAQKEERLRRQEEAEAVKKAATLKARPTPIRMQVTVPIREQPGVTIPPPSQPQVQRSSSIASKRSSMHLSRSTSTSSANRNSVVVAKSTVTPIDAAHQRLKGKEVFNRDKMEKEARERERKEKEEAAKRARAEAAERGRIASREWAERQRKKMMGP